MEVILKNDDPKMFLAFEGEKYIMKHHEPEGFIHSTIHLSPLEESVTNQDKVLCNNVNHAIQIKFY